MTETIIDLAIEGIELRDRLRNVDEASMLAIAASFGERGQDQPIIVRDRDDGSNKVRLVAGAHRVCAARYLGWPTIKAVVRDMTDDEARLAEIDENVIRRELSALDRAIFLAERKKVYERLHPETVWGKNPKAKKGDEGRVLNMRSLLSFSKDAAKKTGLSKATIERATGLMLRLSPEVIDIIRSTPLADNGGALKKLSRVPDKADQLTVAKLLQSGEAKTLNVAFQKTGLIPAAPPEGTVAAKEDALLTLLSRSTASDRRTWLITILKRSKTGEMTALINGLNETLPLTHRQNLYTALRTSLSEQGYLNDQGEVA